MHQPATTQIRIPADGSTESTHLLNRLRLIGDHFKDCFTIVDMAGAARQCIYVNSAFTSETGFSSNDTLGRNLAFLQGERSSSVAVDFMRHCFENRIELPRVTHAKISHVLNNPLPNVPYSWILR